MPSLKLYATERYTEEAVSQVALETAANAVLIAAFVNTGWKVGLAAILGTWRFALKVAYVILPALAAGALALFLL